MPSHQYDDAALARALQEEYEKEYRKRSMQQHLGQTISSNYDTSRATVAVEAQWSPASNNNYNPPPTAPSALEQDSFLPFSPFSNESDNYFFVNEDEGAIDGSDNIEVSDAAFARQLEQRMVEEEIQRQSEAYKRRKERSMQRTDSFQQRAGTTAAFPTRSMTPIDRAPRSREPVGDPRSRARDRARSNSRSRKQPPSRNNSGSLNNTNHSARSNSLSRQQPPSRNNSSILSNTNHSSSDHTRAQKMAVVPQETAPRSMQSAPSQRSLGGLERTPSAARLHSTPATLADMVRAKPPTLSDAEIARRLEQEERDEALAREFAAREQLRRSNKQSNVLVNSDANQSNHRRGKCVCCNLRRILSCCTSIILIVVAVVLFLYFFGDKGVRKFIPDPTRFKQEDPFNNANPADANVWNTGGRHQGLALTILNALDNKWYEYFYKAVSQWDSGSPDALTLTTQTVDPDSVCRPVDGVMKVCNGNYGDTGWRGINKVLLQNGFIYSSAARMNEYYTDGNSDDQRQYTMCHEMGHGFGLPHTDENFFNKDLGNCMDYTMHPEVNKQPSYPNFKFLAQLYGTLDGSPVPTDDAINGTAVSNNQSVPQNSGGGRHLRGRDHISSLPPQVEAALVEIDRLVNSGMIGTEEQGWRLLHQSSHGEAHEIDVGDGYTVQIHMIKDR